MWLQYEIASVYRNLLYEVKSFFQPEPKVNTGTFHVYHVATSSSCHPPPPPVIVWCASDRIRRL
jgi:hypothetical protein